MKNKCKQMLCLLMVFTVCILSFTSCAKRKNKEPDSTTTSSQTETTTQESVSIDAPITEVFEEIPTEPEEPQPQKPQSTTNEKSTTTAKRRTITTKAAASVKTTASTKKTSTTSYQGKTTRASAKSTQTTTKKTAAAKYSCGVKNHNCTTPEEHAFLTSLEEKGCPICGSHSCRSFYALDEWGNTCYDITKCPQYKEEEDPTIRCEHCGRVSGTGDNGTCVRFTVDTVCPICGKTVKAKTCHTH